MVIRWQVPPSRRAVFVVVLAVMLASITITALGNFRLGGYLLASAMALAAVARAVLPERYCLGLLVRSRTFDVITGAVFAAAIAATTAILPGA